MTIGMFLKVLALAFWLLAAIWEFGRPANHPYTGGLVAAGLFCWFIGDLIKL